MEHSLIYRAFKRIFDLIEKYYKLSFTRKLVNNISQKLRIFFVNSSIYKFLTRNNYNAENVLRFSIIGRIEALIQKALGFLHVVYDKGISGSSMLKLEWNIKRVGVGFYSLIIIAGLLTYNLLSFIYKSVHVFQLYVSMIIVFFTIQFYFLDGNNIYRNSFIKKVIDGFFHDGAEE